MKKLIQSGATNQTFYTFIPDSSSSVGAGLTGVAHDSSGLICQYVRPLSNAVNVNLVTQTTTGSHTDGGFVEVDVTGMPGVYRLDLPDAVFAAGVDSAVVMLHGATSMAPSLMEVQIGTDIEFADALLKRDVSNTEEVAAVNSLTRVVLSAQGWETIDVTGLRINKTDGSEFDTIPITTGSSNNLIISIG